jgi:glycerol-3-phosphate acyltransferase PlsY
MTDEQTEQSSHTQEDSAMDWWKRLFDADRLIPMILGFVGGVTGLFFSFQGTGENAVSIGSVSVNPPQLGLGCACLVLSAFLLIRYVYLYRDGNPYEYLP